MYYPYNAVWWILKLMLKAYRKVFIAQNFKIKTIRKLSLVRMKYIINR